MSTSLQAPIRQAAGTPAAYPVGPTVPETMRYYDPLAVANTFLLLAGAEQVPMPLTQMKLQKLVYIAHGWNLAIHGRSLLDERVEAWEYGPVIRSLYYASREFGGSPITRLLALDPQKRADFDKLQQDQDAMSVILKVWDVYKKFSASDLSAMTHRPGTPWYKAWIDDGGQYSRGTDLDTKEIQRHFVELGSRTR